MGATPIFAAVIGLALGTEKPARAVLARRGALLRRCRARRDRHRQQLSGDLRRNPLRPPDRRDLGRLLRPHHAAHAPLLGVADQRLVLPISWVGIAIIGWPQTSSQDWHLGWEVWVLLVVATLGPLVVTNILWFRSLDRIGASRATLATNLQPFLAAVVAVVLLGEHMNLVQVLGGVLIAAGILARPPPRARLARGVTPRGSTLATMTPAAAHRAGLGRCRRGADGDQARHGPREQQPRARLGGAALGHRSRGGAAHVLRDRRRRPSRRQLAPVRAREGRAPRRARRGRSPRCSSASPSAPSRSRGSPAGSRSRRRRPGGCSRPWRS